MLTIPKRDRETLIHQANLKKLETGEYLKDENNKNFKYIKDKFFYNENDNEKAKLLNVGSGIFTTISEVFPFYVGNPDKDFGMMFDDVTRDIVSLGFATIGIQRIDGKLEMVYEPAKNYWNDNGLDKIGRLYVDDDDNYYLLVQSYHIGYIESRLYALQSCSLDRGNEVSLDTIPQTFGLKQIIDTGLNVPALIIINDSCTSTFEKIKQLVYGVDRQIVMNHTQYLQNVDSFVLFKGIKWPTKLMDNYNKGNTINFSQIGRIVNADVDGSIEFIDNVNSLIKDAIQETDSYIRRIASIVSLPIEFLGLDSNEGAVGQGSRTLRHGAFMKKVQYYRDLIDEAIVKFLEIAKPKEDMTYSWPDIFVKTDKELAEEIAIAREQKIISRVDAIKKYNGYTDDEAQKELEIIKAENDVLPADPNLEGSQV